MMDGMKMGDMESVLEGDSTDMETGSEESDSESEYDAYATELGELLELDEEKALQLRDLICGLARYEMDGGNDEEESESKPSKKGKGDLAIVLG